MQQMITLTEPAIENFAMMDDPSTAGVPLTKPIETPPVGHKLSHDLFFKK